MLRQRRNKRGGPRKPKQQLAWPPNEEIASSPTSSFRDFIGLRALRKDAPRSAEQKQRLFIDSIIASCLFFITLATRFYRLSVPDRIVFDEVHFAAFIHHYIKGEYLFDIHPPLGKLTLVAVAQLSGYQPLNFSFQHIGTPYGEMVFYPQRAFAALTGSFIPPVLYLAARSLSLSLPPSFVVGLMPLTDHLLCIESRLILTDSQLILYIQLAFLFAFHLWQTPCHTPRRYLFLVLTALSAACALATKWTAFVAPSLIALNSLVGFVLPHARLLLVEMALAAVLAAIIYIGSFFLHFRLLPLSGPGDAFMPIEFQRTLPGNANHVPGAIPRGFFENFWYLNWEMLRANSGIEARHPWESKWYEWLYNARGILYSDEATGSGKRELIYPIVNPALAVITLVGVGTAVLLVLAAPLAARRAKRREMKVAADGIWRRGHILIFLLVGWFGNLLPYIGISRCTFLYHVLPALQTASLMTGVVLDALPRWRGLTVIVCSVVAFALGWAFYQWLPWVYALPRTPDELARLRWMPRWN